MKRIALAAPIVLFITVSHAASFDCSKAGTRIEHLICDSPEISKLDDELAASYKDALHNSGNSNAIKQEQRQWVRDRNRCLDALCVRNAYLQRKEQLNAMRNKKLRFPTDVSAPESAPTADGGSNPTGITFPQYKGEYVLRRGSDPVCAPFTADLNQFRQLDFDECNPRLSGKFPEISRPYQWKEIPFDMALAEKAIRSTTDYDLHTAEDPKGAEYEQKLAEQLWQQWKKDASSYVTAGAARMWVAKIDIYGDGHQATILRMVPGGRFKIDPKRPSLWTCDYNIGEFYVLDSANPAMTELFNKSAGTASDIVHFSENGHFYLVSWDPVASTALQGWLNDPISSIGGTRGVTVSTLYRGKEGGNNYAGNSPATACLIDWVPDGQHAPAPRSR